MFHHQLCGIGDRKIPADSHELLGHYVPNGPCHVRTSRTHTEATAPRIVPFVRFYPRRDLTCGDRRRAIPASHRGCSRKVGEVRHTSVRSAAARSPARPCTCVARTAASKGRSPCASSVPHMPANTSPVPAVAIPALPASVTAVRERVATTVRAPLRTHATRSPATRAADPILSAWISATVDPTRCASSPGWGVSTAKPREHAARRYQPLRAH